MPIATNLDGPSFTRDYRPAPQAPAARVELNRLARVFEAGVAGEQQYLESKPDAYLVELFHEAGALNQHEDWATRAAASWIAAICAVILEGRGVKL